MVARMIVGLKSDYGSLDLRAEDRVLFTEDAQRLLRGIGDVLKGSGAISGEYLVRHLPSKIVIGYAGEIVASYVEPRRRFAVSLVFAHTPDEVKTRPDGVAGYALYRRMKANPKGSSDEPGIDPSIQPEDRRPLYGTYPEGLIQLVQTMLADHPMNPDAPRRQQAAS